MSEEVKDDTQYAKKIKESADRLFRLCELIAPELIIEQERRLLFKHLINFPVDRETQTRSESLSCEMASKEQDFLVENGFYTEVLGSLEPPKD